MIRSRFALTICLLIPVSFISCATTSSELDNESSGNEQKIESAGKLLQTKPANVEKLGETGNVKAFEVGSVTVLHKRTPANSVVSAKFYLGGGSLNLRKETTGLEKLALNVATSGGTRLLPKDHFNSRLNSMGSSIQAFSSKDFSGYSMKSVNQYFEPTWDLFVDSIVQPALPKNEFKQQKKAQLASLRQRKQNPDRWVSFVSTELLFKNHTYQHRQLGTKKNIKQFEQRDLEKYHRSLLKTGHKVLAVVGDVSTEKLLDRVSATLGRLPDSEFKKDRVKRFDVKKRDMRMEKKDIPTNYILGTFPAPKPGSKDYPAVKLAIEYLSDRLFEEIRTKRNLTYAVASGLGYNRANYGYLYVTATKPNKTISIMLDEVNKLKEEPISKKALKETRNVFVTEHFMSMETNANQAADLAEKALIDGDWRRHATFIEDLDKVKPADIQRVAKKYFKNYQFGVVGHPKQIDADQFGIKRDKPSENSNN